MLLQEGLLIDDYLIGWALVSGSFFYCPFGPLVDNVVLAIEHEHRRVNPVIRAVPHCEGPWCFGLDHRKDTPVITEPRVLVVDSALHPNLSLGLQPLTELGVQVEVIHLCDDLGFLD